jgi:WD40 repeat protein
MDLALVTTTSGLFGIDVDSGHVSYALNDSNASVVVPVGTVSQGGASGTRLVCSPQLPKGLIHYWRLNAGSGLPESSGNAVYKCSCPEKITSLVFSSCGGLMFAGSGSGTMYVWQTYTGNLLRTWTAHFGSVAKIILNKDDSVLITASEDSTVKAFFCPEIFAGSAVVTPMTVFSGHSGKINDIVLVEGKMIASASADKSIKIFDLFGGEQVSHLTLSESEPTRLTCTLTGDLFVGCADGAIHSVVGDQLSMFAGKHLGPITGLAVTLDGSRVVSCSEADGVKIWDTSSLMLVHSIIGQNQQLKQSLGMLMLRKPVVLPESVEAEMPHPSMQYVSGIDTYLQLKPLQRTVTRPETIDVIPLIRVAKSGGVHLPKVKNGIVINRASVEEGAVGHDPLAKAQAELVKQRELTKMWASAYADVYTRLSTFTANESELALPLGEKTKGKK